MAEVSDTRIQCCIQPISGYDGYNNTIYLKLASLTSLDTMDTMLYPAQFWIRWIRIQHVGRYAPPPRAVGVRWRPVRARSGTEATDRGPPQHYVM